MRTAAGVLYAVGLLGVACGVIAGAAGLASRDGQAGLVAVITLVQSLGYVGLVRRLGSSTRVAVCPGRIFEPMYDAEPGSKIRAEVPGAAAGREKRWALPVAMVLAALDLLGAIVTVSPFAIVLRAFVAVMLVRGLRAQRELARVDVASVADVFR